jgi:hypothetical protein
VGGSGASHRYGAIANQTLSISVPFLVVVNFGSRALHIGARGGAHCPLI